MELYTCNVKSGHSSFMPLGKNRLLVFDTGTGTGDRRTKEESFNQRIENGLFNDINLKLKEAIICITHSHADHTNYLPYLVKSLSKRLLNSSKQAASANTNSQISVRTNGQKKYAY